MMRKAIDWEDAAVCWIPEDTVTVTISSEDEALLHTLVNAGAFHSVEHALHMSIAGMASAVLPVEPDAEWLAYADERIKAGLADADAGRTIPAEQFLEEMHSRRRNERVMRIEVTHQARVDRDEIIDHYGEGSYGADRFIEQVTEAFDHLARWPDSAGRHPRLSRSELRFWLTIPYYIVFQRNSDHLVVIAILHTSRNISPELRRRFKQ